MSITIICFDTLHIMDPQVCLAGMNGQDLANIKSPQELIDLGMDKKTAEEYYILFQYFKDHGVPKEYLEKDPKKN